MLVGYVKISIGHVGSRAIESPVSGEPLYQACDSRGLPIGRPSNMLREQQKVVEATVGGSKRVKWTLVTNTNTMVSMYQAEV